MQPQEYDLMSDLQLLILMDWREAEGEGLLGKRGVAHSAKNRADMPGWWGGPSLKSVILKPMQFSSFNPGNPRERDWPDDNQPAYQDCVTICTDVLYNGDEDITHGATNYFDISIPTPIWAQTMQLTLAVGRLRFYKLAQEST